VIDPLSDFCSGKKVLAEVLHRLNRLVSDRQVAIVVTLRADCRFNRDGEVVVKSRYDTAAARCQWCCVADPEEPGQPGRHLFLPTLMNYTALPPGRAYRLGRLELAWDEAAVDPRRPLKSEDACATWLRELLEPQALPATEIKRLGRDLGFSDSKIYRARKKIDAKILPEIVKGKPKSYWSTGKGRLPDLDQEIQQAVQSADFDKLGDEPLGREEIAMFFPGQGSVEDVQDPMKRQDAASTLDQDLDEEGDDLAAYLADAEGNRAAQVKPAEQFGASEPSQTLASLATAIVQAAGPVALGGEQAFSKGDDDEGDWNADWEEIKPASFPASDAEVDRILNGQPHVAVKETARTTGNRENLKS
jgi:hypothetical protein